MAAETTMEVDTSTPEDKSREVVKQIEFYFHDSNLPYDKYMWTLYSKTPEHWVPLKIIASFKRMRPLSEQGVPWIASQIRETSNFLEVDESGENVRRKSEPQPPKNVFDRSVYAKGFGLDEKGGELLNEIQTFFSKWGQVNAVRMRRDNDKKFKSSVFAEFEDYDAAQTFINAPDSEKMWNGEQLVAMTKEAYCLKKMKEKGISGDVEELRRSANLPSGGNAKHKFNAFREMAHGKKSGGESTRTDEKNGAEKKPRQIQFSYGSATIDVNPDGSIDEEKVQIPNQSVVEFTGVGDGPRSFAEIKTALKPVFSRVPHITFSEGASFGAFIFTQTVTDDQLEEIKTKVPQIGGADVTYSRADETKERELQLKNIRQVAELTVNSPKNKSDSRGDNNRGRGGRGGGRGGARGGRGRGRGGTHNGGGRDAKKDDSKPASNAPPTIASTPAAAAAADTATSAIKRKADDNADGDASAKKTKTDVAS